MVHPSGCGLGRRHLPLQGGFPSLTHQLPSGQGAGRPPPCCPPVHSPSRKSGSVKAWSWMGLDPMGSRNQQ